MSKTKLITYIALIVLVIILAIIAILNRNSFGTTTVGENPPAMGDGGIKPPSNNTPEFIKVIHEEHQFSYDYPTQVFSKTEVKQPVPYSVVSEEVVSDVLTHTAPLPYCNAKGECERTTTNIKVSIFPVNAQASSLEAALTSAYGNMQVVMAGVHSFKTVTAGAEGEGEIYYVISVAGGKSILVTQRYIDENILINYKGKQEFIPLEEQKRVTQNLLASFVVRAAEAEPEVSYELIHNHTGEFATNNYFDARLVSKNSITNVETVLVPSIKKAIPELQKAFNLTLEELSLPSGSDNLYFTVILSETDAPPGDIYRFNISTKKFTRLVTASSYRGFGEQDVSPSGLFIATTFDFGDTGTFRKLYLIDLEKDLVTTLVTLPATETLNSCVEGNCFGGNYGDIAWVNSTAIEYSVFDAQKTSKDEFGNDNRPLKGKRIVTIK